MSRTRNEILEQIAQSGGSDTEFGLNIQRGLIPGLSVIHKFGNNPDIDSGSGFETLWNGGGEYTGFNATVAETVEVLSSSADDAAAGTGARTIELRGLGPGFVEQTETVVLNGVTPVDSAGTFLRMDRAVILTAGSGGENVGEITVRQKTTQANVFAVMPATTNRTLIAAYTIPAGKVGYILSGFASLSKKQSATCVVRARFRMPGGVFQVVEIFAINSTGTSYVYRDFHTPLIRLPAGTDFFIEADSDTNDTGVSGGFELVLVETE